MSRPSPACKKVREAAHLSEKVREAPGCAGSQTVRQTNRLLVGAIGRGDLGERWGWGYKRGLEHRSLVKGARRRSLYSKGGNISFTPVFLHSPMSHVSPLSTLSRPTRARLGLRSADFAAAAELRSGRMRDRPRQTRSTAREMSVMCVARLRSVTDRQTGNPRQTGKDKAGCGNDTCWRAWPY